MKALHRSMTSSFRWLSCFSGLCILGTSVLDLQVAWGAGLHYRARDLLSPFQKGMGGVQVSVVEGPYALWGNAAHSIPPKSSTHAKTFLSQEAGTSWRLLPIHLVLSDAFISQWDPTIAVLDSFDDMVADQYFSQVDSLLQAVDRLAIGIGTQFPLEFHYTSSSWAFSTVLRGEAYVLPISGVLPSLLFHLHHSFEALFRLISYRASLLASDDLVIGAGVKAAIYQQSQKHLSAAETYALWIHEDDALGSLLRDDPAVGIVGGIHGGLLWHVWHRFTLGIAMMDALALGVESASSAMNDVSWGLLRPNAKIGLAYHPIDSPSLFLNHIVVACELHHLFDNAYTMQTRLHMGISLEVIRIHGFMWKLAGGCNKGLLTFATSLETPKHAWFPSWHLSYAFYQDEWGQYANTFVQLFHTISLSTHL